MSKVEYKDTPPNELITYLKPWLGCHQKRGRELERAKCSNTEATKHGEHTDPNRPERPDPLSCSSPPL
jgi:hypothetical protein